MTGKSGKGGGFAKFNRPLQWETLSTSSKSAYNYADPTVMTDFQRNMSQKSRKSGAATVSSADASVNSMSQKKPAVPSHDAQSMTNSPSRKGSSVTPAIPYSASRKGSAVTNSRKGSDTIGVLPSTSRKDSTPFNTMSSKVTVASTSRKDSVPFAAMSGKGNVYIASSSSTKAPSTVSYAPDTSSSSMSDQQLAARKAAVAAKKQAAQRKKDEKQLAEVKETYKSREFDVTTLFIQHAVPTIQQLGETVVDVCCNLCASMLTSLKRNQPVNGGRGAGSTAAAAAATAPQLTPQEISASWIEV